MKFASWKRDAVYSLLWLLASLVNGYYSFLNIVTRGGINFLTTISAFFVLICFSLFVSRGLSAIKGYKEEQR